MDSFFYRPLGQFLSTVIQCLQITGKYHGIPFIFCSEKCQCTFCRIQSASRIDTWAKYKPDMICTHLIRRYPRTLHQCAKPRIRTVSHHFQCLFYKDPVLICQIHYISNGRNANWFQQIIQICRILSHGFIQTFHAFIRYRGSTKSFKWIFTSRLLWVDHCICWR